MGLKPGDVDLSGAVTLGDKIRRVAERAPMNEVNATETADLLLALGVTECERDALRSMVWQRLDASPEYPEDWSEGWWRLGSVDETPEDNTYDPTRPPLAIRAVLELNDAPPTHEDVLRSSVHTSMNVVAEEVDFGGAKTTMQRLLRIAKASPSGEVCTIEVVDMLIDLGLVAPSSRESCRSYLHDQMKQHPDFKRLRRGWFIYKGRSVAGTDHENASPEEFNPMLWLPGDVDYGDATNLSRRLVHMAAHTQDGKIDPNQAAQRLTQDGQSYQQLSSLTRLVRQTMRKHPDFRELPNGWFWWIAS